MASAKLLEHILSINVSTSSVPQKAGVLMLPDVPLFPQCTVELHLFEERYLAMMQDLLQEDWRLAIGSLTEPEVSDLSQCVAPVGLLGVIRVAKKLPDGRYNLVLEGTHPVEFTRWEEQTPYPKATLRELIRSPLTQSEESGRSLILHAIESHLAHLDQKEAAKILSFFREIEDFTQFTDSAAHHFVTDFKTRLRLLSEPEGGKRASLLIQTLTV